MENPPVGLSKKELLQWIEERFGLRIPKCKCRTMEHKVVFPNGYNAYPARDANDQGDDQ